MRFSVHMPWNAMRFAIKHAVAAGVVVGGIVAFTAASYFALLIWSVLAGLPLGGPLAFPFMVLLALVASIVCVLFLIFPATAVTEWVCARYRLQLAVQIPVAAAVLGLLVFGVMLTLAAVQGRSIGAVASLAAIVSVILLVLLGAYWWSMQSADLLIRAGARLWQNVRSAMSET